MYVGIIGGWGKFDVRSRKRPNSGLILTEAMFHIYICVTKTCKYLKSLLKGRVGGGELVHRGAHCGIGLLKEGIITRGALIICLYRSPIKMGNSKRGLKFLLNILILLYFILCKADSILNLPSNKMLLSTPLTYILIFKKMSYFGQHNFKHVYGICYKTIISSTNN